MKFLDHRNLELYGITLRQLAGIVNGHLRQWIYSNKTVTI